MASARTARPSAIIYRGIRNRRGEETLVQLAPWFEPPESSGVQRKRLRRASTSCTARCSGHVPPSRGPGPDLLPGPVAVAKSIRFSRIPPRHHLQPWVHLSAQPHRAWDRSRNGCGAAPSLTVPWDSPHVWIDEVPAVSVDLGTIHPQRCRSSSQNHWPRCRRDLQFRLDIDGLDTSECATCPTQNTSRKMLRGGHRSSCRIPNVDPHWVAVRKHNLRLSCRPLSRARQCLTSPTSL